MNCQDCKALLYPEDPTVPVYDRKRRRYLLPLCHGCPDKDNKGIDELHDRISNLEAITGQPGRIPRRYFDQLQQLQGQVTNVSNKLNAALERGKKRTTKQPVEERKSTYKGLSA